MSDQVFCLRIGSDEVWYAIVNDKLVSATWRNRGAALAGMQTEQRRSRIVIELVTGAEPGTVFAHEQFRAALAENTARVISQPTIGAAVRSANRRLLKEQQRVLHPVRGIGYRIALASEHNMLALNRRSKADRQLAFGLLTLRNVKWDELDPNARAAGMQTEQRRCARKKAL